MIIIVDCTERLRFPFIQMTFDFADLLNDIIKLFELEIFAQELHNYSPSRVSLHTTE